MKHDSETELPKVKIATEPWVMEQIMSTEQRIEKAFHDQTKYLSQKHDTLTTDMHRSHLQVVLAILAVGMAIVVAVFLR